MTSLSNLPAIEAVTVSCSIEATQQLQNRAIDARRPPAIPVNLHPRRFVITPPRKTDSKQTGNGTVVVMPVCTGNSANFGGPLDQSEGRIWPHVTFIGIK